MGVEEDRGIEHRMDRQHEKEKRKESSEKTTKIITRKKKDKQAGREIYCIN